MKPIPERYTPATRSKKLDVRYEALEQYNNQLEAKNYHLEENYKVLEEQTKILTEENKDLQQRHQRYQKDYNKAKEEKTTLQQRLDRPQDHPSVELKELQKRIDSMTAENVSLVKRLKAQEKYITEHFEQILENQRNECDQIAIEVKKLEEMNTGLKDENERYKMYEKEYNKVTEENTAYEQSIKAYDIYISKLEDENTDLKQRHQKYHKDYNKAKEENRTLQQRCEALEENTYTLEDKNSKLQQRLDRPQAPPSVQVKELQKRIDNMTTENESLIKRLKSQGKCTKETERSGQSARQYKELQNQIATLTAEKESLMQRLQRPQTAQRAGERQYKELQNQIATLTAEKESLMQRLSMVAGMKMRVNNPGIADLSDPNRPEKIAEQFRELYDNAWANLMDYIIDNTDTTEDIAAQEIVAVTQKIFEQCQTEVGKMKRLLLRIIGYPEDTFEKQYTGGKDGHDPIVNMMKDLVQISAEHTYEGVLQKIKEIREIKEILQIGGESADVFLTKCSKLCLFMCVKVPPTVLDFNFQRGDMFDKDKLSVFTTSGDSVGYLVWPVMYLHENGPVMSKGVAQGRKK